jgi:hypothetical protein
MLRQSELITTKEGAIPGELIHLWRPAIARTVWGDLFNRPVCSFVRLGVQLGKRRE